MSWSPWTKCTNSCGLESQTRTRAKLTEEKNGGRPCAGDHDEDKRDCELPPCTPGQYLPKFRGNNLHRFKNKLGPFFARIFAKLSYPMPT